MATVPQTYERESLLSRCLAKQQYEQRIVWEACAARVASFERGPLLWLTRYTKTEDQHWLAKGTAPVAPFPAKSYFLPLIHAMLEEPTLFIIKSREMMTSWLACGFIAWMVQFYPQIFWLMQTDKENKVFQLIDYCRILYRNQPAWMQLRNGLVIDGKAELGFANGGKILGVPSGESQARSYHPYGFLGDEVAFQPEAEACFNAMRPVTKQVINISTDEISWYHNQTKMGA